MTGRIVPSAALLADPSVSDPVLGFAETSYHAGSAAELDATMASYMRRFDIEHFVLYQATDSRRRPSAAKICGASNGEWRKHYDANGLAGSDELLRSGLNSAAPATWTKFRQQNALTDAQSMIYDEARAFGLRDGFYLPIHQRDGSMMGVSMMVSEVMPTTRTTLAALHMLSLYYYMAAERLGLVKSAPAKDETDRPLLTPRQLECLRWVRAGESSWEIGQILNLSEHTVNEHLQSARRRLGVRTTTQAVMEAAARGLIQL